MKITIKDRIYVDPILIEESFFWDEDDYVITMDEVFEGLRKAASQQNTKEETRPTASTVKNNKM